MQPRPSFDRSLLIPIAIGVVSILGIWWILSTSSLGRLVFPPTAIPSSVSTRAATQAPSPSVTRTRDEPPPTAAGTHPAAYPGPATETLPSTGTPIPESSPTPSMTESPPAPSATPTPVWLQPLRAGKYDDTFPWIAYDRDWTAFQNPTTANAYKGTLHVSMNAGSEISFRFTGEQIRLGYQRGRNLGTVTVLIDGEPHSFHEQDFGLVWRSPKLPPGDHFVRILHHSGEAVNLDYIEVLD